MSVVNPNSVIDRFLHPPEVEQLHQGIADLGAISSALLVPFLAQRLLSTRVAWLNRRWFLGRGIDVTLASERARVEAWLVAEFGYIVPAASAVQPKMECKTFYADRYGSTEGTTPHGGSGRSGIAGRFSAKGIGTTPLVGKGAAPGHAHGCASLEECLREAVYSEVIGAEAPHGAVPTIAVLDIGIDFVDPDARIPSQRHSRRGLLIRPCVLRPAHAERAALFRRADGAHEHLNQREDVARTRAIVHTWAQAGLPSDVAVPANTLISRLAQQIAFAQVHRFTGGGVFSSNVSLLGEWLDFGNAHALPDWSHAKVLDHAAGFGAEHVTLRAICQSVAFYLRKYGGQNEPADAIEAKLAKNAADAYGDAWSQECTALFLPAGTVANGSPLSRAVRAYFERQQLRRVRYQYGRAIEGAHADAPWLGDEVGMLASGAANEGTMSEDMRAIYTALQAACAGLHLKRDLEDACRTAMRRLRQRPLLDRGELIDAIHRLLRQCARGAVIDAHAVEAALDDIIGQSRAHWPALPERFIVHAQKAFGSSSVLLCTDGRNGHSVIWLEGASLGHRLRLFDAWLEPDSWNDLRQSRGTWSVGVIVSSFEEWLRSSSPSAQATRAAPGVFQWYGSAPSVLPIG